MTDQEEPNYADYSSNVIDRITISPDDCIYPLYNILTELIKNGLHIDNVEFTHLRKIINYLYKYPEMGYILIYSLLVIKQNVKYSKIIISLDTNVCPINYQSIIITIRQQEYSHDLMNRIDQISYIIEKLMNNITSGILITSDFVCEEISDAHVSK